MSSLEIYRRLSSDQRDFLVEHIDCIVPIEKKRDYQLGSRIEATRKSLIAKKLLKTHPSNSRHPTGTSLTEEGRMTVCLILAESAENLMRAGLLEGEPEETPLETLRRLRSEKVIPRFAGKLYPKAAG